MKFDITIDQLLTLEDCLGHIGNTEDEDVQKMVNDCLDIIYQVCPELKEGK